MSPTDPTHQGQQGDPLHHPMPRMSQRGERHPQAGPPCTLSPCLYFNLSLVPLLQNGVFGPNVSVPTL